ncbi:MAG: NAD-dependent epimerase/dehydratase family protein [Promethearchaeota archaeon]
MISDFNNRKIIVTGAAGFIGSNLTDAFLELGAQVIGIDNLFNGDLNNLENAQKNPNFIFYKEDIRNYSFLLEVCRDVDIIYHEAAFASVIDSIDNPFLCNDININGTLNILESARSNNVKTIVFASSAAVYGETETLPVREIMKPVPISPYAVSKLACENYLYTYFKLYGLNTISLRYMNVYGPRQDLSPDTGVITKWIKNIYNNDDLIIYGDGEQTRDFIHINDVVNANIIAGTIKNISGDFFNIGTGISTTINELANLMIKICGRNNIKIKYESPRIGDIKEDSADINKAKKILKFEPNYDIRSGLINYNEWFKNNYDSL